MNLTSWDLSYPTQAVVIVQTIFTGFLIGSLVVVKCIYKPWLKKIEDEEEPEKYEDKYNLQDYFYRMNYNEIDFSKDVKTNEKNIVNDATPEGNVFMKYDEDSEGFAYWCDDKNIKYDFLDTVARKYCIVYNCFGKYNDRKKSIKDQEEEEKKKEEERGDEEETQEEEESIFIKHKKIETKKTDRSKGSGALKSNQFIYKGKVTKCPVFLKTREQELHIKTKKNMSFSEWISSGKK